MDCPSEEQLVRVALEDVPGVERLGFDLDAREVLVAHVGDRSRIDEALHGLDLGTAHVEDLPGDVLFDEVDERPALWFAFGVNAAFFVVEVGLGLVGGSMGVVADGVDMGADALVYALALLAVGAGVARRHQLARASGWLQFAVAGLGLAEVVRRLAVGAPLPDTVAMVVVTALALVGNVAVLAALRRVRTGQVHLEASWIFTANDVVANLAVLAAILATRLTGSPLPDLVAGGLIFGVVANGARRILRLAG